MSGSSYDSSSFGTESNGQIDEIAYGDYDSEEEYFQQYHHYNPYQMPFNNSKQQTHKQRNENSDDSVELSDNAYEIEW